MWKSFLIILTSAASLLSSCIIPKKVDKYQQVYQAQDTIIVVRKDTSHRVQVMYTGCGGLLIHADSFSILIDPFYSNLGLLKLPLGKLRTDTRQVDAVCRQINDKTGGVNNIKAVLIAHSHYDHFLDLPYLLNTQLRNQTVNVIGCTSAFNALSHVCSPNYTFTIPQTSACKRADTIPLNEQIKLTVIESGHAPHLKLLGFPIHLMKGDIGSAGVKGFDTTGYKARYSRWKEGKNFSFLLQLETGEGQKPFRIFIQSSSCNAPAGIPAFSDATDSVDVAFIGVASTNLTQNYPEELLKAIKPKQVVLIHWEDFFRRYDKDPRLVRLTNFDTFFHRYEKVMGAGYPTFTTMPKPLTTYTFLY